MKESNNLQEAVSNLADAVERLDILTGKNGLVEFFIKHGNEAEKRWALEKASEQAEWDTCHKCVTKTCSEHCADCGGDMIDRGEPALCSNCV